MLKYVSCTADNLLPATIMTESGSICGNIHTVLLTLWCKPVINQLEIMAMAADNSSAACM